MKIACAAIAMLTLCGPAFAFDPTIAELVGNLKPKTLVPLSDIVVLMKGSEQWCYIEENGSCGWSEVYLDVSDAGPRLESSSSYWDGEYNRYIVKKGEFQQDRYVCDYGYDWTPSVRLTRRSDGTPVNDRELDQFRVQFANNFGIDNPDCYDYLFVRADAQANTITLMQRTYSDFVKDEGSDTLVTLYFDADAAKALTLRP